MDESDERAFCRDVESADYWRGLCPGLSITDDLAPVAEVGPAGGAWWTEQRALLVEEGYAEIDDAVPAADARELVACIGRVKDAGKHPVFAFVYDETWRLLSRVAPLGATVLGPGFQVLADFWAWKVDPGAGGGWPPHRGWYQDVAGPEGLPTMINVWLSLSEATPSSACMHIVPLALDPGVRDGRLDSLGFEPQHARALPTRAGSVLLWNANALHWGGMASRRARGPRVSVSFSMRAAVSPCAGALPDLDVRSPLPFKKRLDLVADQIATYTANEAPATARAARWAALVHGMREARRHVPAPGGR